MVIFRGQLSQSQARIPHTGHRAKQALLIAALAVATSGAAGAQYAPPQPPSPPQPGYPSQPPAPQQPGGYGQPPTAASGQPQANARAARLTYLAGDVHIDSAAGAGDEAAALNMPIVEGTVVATGDNGQAEIEFEDGSLVRLTPNSAVSLINLSIDSKGIFVTRLALLPGLAYLELRASAKYQFSVDAGGDMISPVENSAVRVDFDEPPAKIAVLDGSIHVVSQAGISASAVSGQTIREANLPIATQSQPQGSSQYPGQSQSASRGTGSGAMPTTVYGQPVGPGSDGTSPAYATGQPSTATGGPYPPAGQASPPPATGSGHFLIKDSLEPNSWDQWNEDRDQAAANDASSQTDARSGYAGDQGYGWSDLDANGSWYNVPGQGQVWQPDAAAQSGDDAGANSGADSGADSFDPYGYGDWVFTAGYGYVWASGYPWGWTPFRCGNWGYYGGFGWGWSPGAACGLPAYGGQGYAGINLNRTLMPLPYRPPSKPKSGPGHNHPPVIVNGGLAPSSPPHLTPTSRVVAGHVVQSLPPVGGGYTPRGGSAVGSALLRDYPVNRITRTPVVGVLPSHEAPALSASVYHSSSWRPVGAPASNMLPATGKRFSYSPRSSNGQPGNTQTGASQRSSYQSGRPSSPQLPVTVLGTPPPRDPYLSAEGTTQHPQTTGGPPVYRTYPSPPSYGYHPAPASGSPSQGGTTNGSGYNQGYRQPPAPPVQRATPPPPSPSRPAPVSALPGPSKN